MIQDMQKVSILMMILTVGILVNYLPAYAGSPAGEIIKQYEKGLISEWEFEQKLRELQYDETAIRQAKAVAGKLDHQQTGFVEQKESSSYPKSYLSNTNTLAEQTTQSGLAIVTDTSSDSSFLAVFGVIAAITIAGVLVAFFKGVF